MIKQFLKQFFAFAVVFALCCIVGVSLTPFSLNNIVGPVAGIASGILLLWGSSLIFSVIFALILFCIYTPVLFSTPVDLSEHIIVLLTVSLQSFWSLQLAAKPIRDETWLVSRKNLTDFIVKIGPLAAITSGFGGLVLGLLNGTAGKTSLVYAFISSWSASLIVAVFFIPTILFTRKMKNTSKAKQSLVVLSSILGISALSILFNVSQNQYQNKRIHSFEITSEQFETALENEIELIEKQITALSAFFMASENVTSKEFSVYAKYIFHENTSVKGLTWAPIIADSKRHAFESRATKILGQKFFIKNQDAQGNMSLAEQSPFYAPILFVYPKVLNMKDVGYDLLANDNKKLAMDKSVDYLTMVASEPLTFFDDSEEISGLQVFYPIFNAEQLNSAGMIPLGSASVLSGYVIATINLKKFFKNVIPKDTANNLLIYVADESSQQPFILFGEHNSAVNRLSKTIERTVFSRQWRIDVIEAHPWIASHQDWVSWGILIGCTIGGLLYQLLILLMTAYSSELNQQVIRTTRELIIAKEKSEKESKTKTNFLHMLSVELKTPLQAVKGFITQLENKNRDEEKKTKNDTLISDALTATNNVLAIANNIEELSKVGVGKLTLNVTSFDLAIFLKHMENMLNAGEHRILNKVAFNVQKEVPKLVITDQLKLQQLINNVVLNSAQLFKCENLRISVKAHLHKMTSATILLVVTPCETSTTQTKLAEIENEFNRLNTSLAIAKEVCEHLGGALKLTLLPSNEYILTASFKVEIATSIPKPGAISETLDSTIVDYSTKNVLLVDDDPDSSEKIQQYLEKYQCNMTVVDNPNVIDTYISNGTYDLVILACYFRFTSGNVIAQQLRERDEFKSIPIIGIAPQILSENQLASMRKVMNVYITKPIDQATLNNYITTYL